MVHNEQGGKGGQKAEPRLLSLGLSIGLKAPACQVSSPVLALSLRLSRSYPILFSWVTLTLDVLDWVCMFVAWPALRCVFTFIVVPPQSTGVL